MTVTGLPAAPGAATQTLPVRELVPVLASYHKWIVPLLVPLDPVVMRNQLPPTSTDAVQSIVPVRVFDTLNDVFPEDPPTSCCDGDTKSSGSGAV